MQIKAIIIDDEANNRENLQHLLQRHCRNVKVVGTAASAREGIEKIEEFRPDVVLLDIEMPQQNGFDLLEHFSTIDFEVIFVTAFDHYAIRAIKFCALDYLLKPIDVLELKEAIGRVGEKLLKARENKQLRIFLENRMYPQETKKIALPTADKVDFVSVDEILRCRGESNYTHIILRGGEQIMVSRTLKEYEELLGEYRFVRVHQSHLVNLREVKSYVKRDGGYLLMSDGTQVPVSKQRKEGVLRQLAG